MKAWRRGYSHNGAAAAAAAPLILSVQADGSTDVVVIFSAAVTLLTSGLGGLQVEGDGFDWSTQIDPVTVLASSDSSSSHAVGVPWTFNGPDVNLTPQPTTPQSGNTIA